MKFNYINLNNTTYYLKLNTTYLLINEYHDHIICIISGVWASPPRLGKWSGRSFSFGKRQSVSSALLFPPPCEKTRGRSGSSFRVWDPRCADRVHQPLLRLSEVAPASTSASDAMESPPWWFGSSSWWWARSKSGRWCRKCRWWWDRSSASYSTM